MSKSKSSKPKTYRPRLYRSIFQIKYEKKLTFYTKFPILCEVFSDFEDWEYNTFSLVPRDKKRKFTFRFESSSSTYSQDSHDEDLEKRMIERCINEVTSTLKINDFLRVGYRRFYLTGVDFAFKDLTKIVGLKLFNPEESFTSIFPGKLSDMRYTSVSQEEGYNYQITIGPVQKKEISAHLSSDRNNFNGDGGFNAWESKYPKAAVLIDIDCSITEDNTSQNIEERVDRMNQKSKEIAGDFINFIYVQDKKLRVA